MEANLCVRHHDHGDRIAAQIHKSHWVMGEISQLLRLDPSHAVLHGIVQYQQQ